MNQGFSLTEVLVSLCLVSSASLTLIKQQWQVSLSIYQYHEEAAKLVQLDNETEHRLADQQVKFLLGNNTPHYLFIQNQVGLR